MSAGAAPEEGPEGAGSAQAGLDDPMPPAAPRRFGPWTLTFLVVANMIGAGVFTTSGFTLAELGTPGRVLLAWALGGVVALAGAVSYGRLVRVIPESGGEYRFLSSAAHPLLGQVAGWTSLIAGFAGAIAFAATALESYLLPASVRPDWLPTDAVAIAVVLAAALLHGWGPGLGASLQNVAVALKLVLLVTFVGFAVAMPGGAVWSGGAVEGAGELSILALASALVWISLSYSGFNAAVYVAEESTEVARIVPRALLVGTVVTTILYLGLNAIFVLAPPPGEVAGSPDVAAVAARWIGGDALERGVRGVIAVALLTSVSSLSMAGPRVAVKMAEDGLLPGRLRFREGRPLGAVLLQAGLAVLIIALASLEELLGYLGLTLSLCAALTVGCLFVPGVRAREPVGSGPWIPGFFVAATVLSGVLLALRSPAQLVAAGVTFAVGTVMHLATRRRGTDRSA